MKAWESDKSWSDQFIPEIKRVLADVFVCAAPEYEDQRHNTDLMVFMLKPARVACRIRRHKYFIEYPDDITIRRDRPSKNISEIEKLMSGYGDYLFYGFSNQAEDALCDWTLLDLSGFRLWFIRQTIQHGIPPGMVKENKDGSSSFKSFSKAVMPSELIYKSYRESTRLAE